MKNPKIILITGASSGLGAELAKSYAAPGIKLHLFGRNQQRLDEISFQCTDLGAIVKKHTSDVCNEKKMRDILNKIFLKDEVDLVIANAGISGGTSGGSEGEEQIRKIFATNLGGLLNTILPAIPYFEERGKGQIAITSSLAGFRGMPSCPAYSASKGAVKLLGEGLRGMLSKKNIEVTVITPGYIETPMTKANNFPMPFLIKVEKAAQIIKSKLKNNPARISFPWPLHLVVWFLSCLSPTLTDPLFARLPSKTPIGE